MEKKIRYFLYARKSSEAEDRQVASLQSQIDELYALAKEEGIDVIGVITDEKSAKAPNERKGYAEMLLRIESGEAKGILCWKLDRLARNPVDGGQINWFLQKGIIQRIRTHDREYKVEDNVLLMMLEFGIANQFILDLSENTKRGMRAKVSKGWFPHYAPFGYINRHIRKGECDIIPDPDRFEKVRKLWYELIYHHKSFQELHSMAFDQLNLTLRHGKKMAYSKFLTMFSNPFYYGRFRHKGELYDGKHTPMVSKEEWDLAQQIVHSRGRSRKKRYNFAYTGMIRCGYCGSMITAEEKVKNIVSGGCRVYRYYRCSKSRDKKCPSKPINEKEIERQVVEFLIAVQINPRVHEIVMAVLKTETIKDGDNARNIYRSHQRDLNKVNDSLNTLVRKNLDGIISDSDYIKFKKKFLEERKRLEKLLRDNSRAVTDWIGKAEKVLNFAEKAKELFMSGDLEIKKKILLFLGSNFYLRDNKLEFKANRALVKLKSLHLGSPKRGFPIEPIKGVEKQSVSRGQSSNISRWGG
ncbi:MAG: recombinase family protein [Candidatus Edwardsbacteria bacterium]|nr:recombinase family protein [Candidatus Edwardsbacteria bacterium]MBU2463526.1 recombinase family protein [Candidatus Edwardsbacteria bacterium]MBU2595155.1 recombinase family protein [Candidatus Edwardsbacteria bacterium]